MVMNSWLHSVVPTIVQDLRQVYHKCSIEDELNYSSYLHLTQSHDIWT
jgi:hypothetical protein